MTLQLIGADTESYPDGSMLSLSASTSRGSGFTMAAGVCIPMESLEATWHYFLHDGAVLLRAGYSLPAINHCTFLMLKLLQADSLGLKANARRELGMVMRDYMDVVGPYQRKASLEYLHKALGVARLLPPPIPQLIRESLPDGSGITTKLYKPTPLSRMGKPKRKADPAPDTGKIARLLRDIEDGKLDKEGNPPDALKRWKEWGEGGDGQTQAVEEVIGEHPVASLADVPDPERMVYECLSKDSLVRTEEGYKPIGILVRDKYSGRVASIDNNGQIVWMPVVGWYRNNHSERVDWLSIKTEDTRIGRWGVVSGTRYTPNHRVLARRGGITSWTEVQYLDHSHEVALPLQRLTQNQMSIAVGSLLGDGSISRRNSNGWAALSISHAAKQKDYLDWKAMILGDLVSSRGVLPSHLVNFPTYQSVSQDHYRLGTSHRPEFSELRSSSYRDGGGRRFIGDWIKNLTPLALAVAYQDNGTLVGGKVARLYLDRFDEASVELLQDQLSVIGVETTRYESRPSYFAIHVRAISYKAFFSIIAPYVHPCMEYKLPECYRGRFNPDTNSGVSGGPVWSRVSEVVSNPISPGRVGFKTSYCIDVAQTHNFLTQGEIAHNCQDSDAGLRLFHVLKPRLQSAGLWDAYQLDIASFPMVAEMEANGILVDRPRLLRLIDRLEQRLAEVEADCWTLAGYAFNPQSSDQVAHLLYRRMGLKPRRFTEGGSEGTQDDDILPYRLEYPIVSRIIEYRRLLKLKTTYAEPYARLSAADGRVRCRYGLSQTIRFQGREPNLSAIPAHMGVVPVPEAAELHNCFIPSPGMVFLAWDAAQIEMRVTAHHSQDAEMIRCFWADEDIHTTTAMEVFELTAAEVLADEDKYRYPMKRTGFGIVYGLTGSGLYRQMEYEMPGRWTEPQCFQFIEDYLDKRPGVRQYMADTIAQGRRTGEVRDLVGHRLLCPALRSPNDKMKQDEERRCVNFRIQAGAVSIVKAGMAQVYQALQPLSSSGSLRWLLQEHDAIKCEVEEDWADGVKSWVKELLEGAMELRVPVKASSQMGMTLGELH